MKIDTRELLERLSTSRREFNATAFAELDRNLSDAVSYTHLRAHETDSYLVCRLLLEKKNKTTTK